MDDPHDGAYAREPQAEDIARICHALNAEGACYILIGGDVTVPVASLPTLLRTKQTVRASDQADRLFLESLLRELQGD